MTADDANRLPSLPALPGPVRYDSEPFHRCLAELIRLIGLHLPPARVDEPLEPGDHRRPGLSEHDVMHHKIRQGLDDRRQLPEEFFDALLRAAIYDPDPSCNRQLVDPAVVAFGRRRVLEALLRYLTTGTNPERAGAARACYWAAPHLEFQGNPTTVTPESQAEWDAYADIRARWCDAALREFVANDDLKVRRNILPVLPLHPNAHPAESHDLVATAVRIARTHPDEYIRHRVKIQILDGED